MKVHQGWKKSVKKLGDHMVSSLKVLVQEVELSALWSVIWDVKGLDAGPQLLGIAPLVYCERLHGAFAQSFDVIQETGWCQNVRRP